MHLLLALHLFKYNLDELYLDDCHYDANKINDHTVQLEIDFLCNNLIIPNRELYKYLYEQTAPQNEKTEIIHKDNQLYEINLKTGKKCGKVFFDLTQDNSGILIQDRLHYIGQHRADTAYHFGLFRENTNMPFSYSAYSVLDRSYLLNLPYFNDFAPDTILVNTRNFGFRNNPHNAMSVLFKEAVKYIRQNTPTIQCIVSAINPNLMFSASSYYASGFQPIATSPLNYSYIDGIYATRRKTEISPKPHIYAKTKPKPIVWFVKTVQRKKYDLINKRIQQYGITKITEADYANK